MTPLGKLRARLLLLAVLTFVGYYFADAAMDALIFDEGSFWQQVIDPDTHEIFIRLLHLFFQSLILWLAWLLFIEGQRLETSLQLSYQDLAQANAELRAANTQLKSFNYSLSHDLQTPLTGILMAAEMLADGQGAPKMDTSVLHKAIYDSAQKMRNLVDSMLLLAGLGLRAMKIEPVDLSAIAREIAAEQTRINPQRQIHWEIEEGLCARGDRQLLIILLENLLSNACKYTAGEEIARIVFKKRAGDPDSFEVSDNGVGFDVDRAAELFKPFSRLHSSETYPGNGIGLATALNIVERHQGKIWATSEPGRGSSFCFQLGSD
jgi:signal transduction histidine kinase